MSEQRRDYILFIEDILTCIEKIERYTSNVSFEEFCGNDMAVDAVIRNFEIIGEAVKKIYRLTADFPKEETYGLVSQIRRAAVSIPSNIAEGAARNLNKEFIQFLYVSLGSLAELETQLLLSKELGFLKNEQIDGSIERIRRMLLGLIKYLKDKQTSNG